MLEDGGDEMMEAFRRAPDMPRPEWAFQHQDIRQELDQVPFFMRDVPENAEDNVPLQALQSLLYDGTPEEIATNFKNQGNEAYADALAMLKRAQASTEEREVKGFTGTAKSMLRDAEKFYTRGLDEVGPVEEVGEALRKTLRLNRAAVNMALKNYGMVKRDCLAVLQKEGSDQKALLRYAKAAFQLGQFHDALEHLQLIQSNSEEVVNLMDTCRRLVLKSPKTGEDPLQTALQTRNLRKRSGVENWILRELPSLAEVPTVQLIGDVLHFPVLFFYPPYGESDFVQSWPEDVSFAEQLEAVLLGAEWDTEGLYQGSAVSVLMRHSEDGDWVDVDPARSIRSLLGSCICSYEHGLLAAYILPQSMRTSFLAKHGA